MLETWAFVIGLCVLGFILLVLELFVFPGFGVSGILGLMGILGGVVYAASKLGLWIGVAVFFVSFIFAIFAIQRATTGRSLLWLQNSRTSPGRITTTVKSVHHLPEIGQNGVSLTPLHPSGVVIIDEQRYDVIIDGPIVDTGVAVEVVELIGNVVKVRAV
jgi:membrane-bound serine protease (ClpP class)